MPIHTLIRQKRVELGLTQEQVAQRLGVTAPAVNKWEKGATCPDIALLPPLARLLNTDLNTLLCFQEDLTDQEIGRFTVEVSDTIRQEGYAAGFARALECLRTYPSCDRLLQNLAMVLEGGLLTAGLSGEEKRSYEERILDCYERLMDSEDPMLRDSACYMLAGRRIREGAYEQAQTLLDRLPVFPGIDRRMLQAQLFLRQDKTEEGMKLLEQTCLCHANGLQMTLMALLSAACQAGERETAGQIADCYNQVLDVLGLWPYGKTVVALELAMDRREAAENLAALEEMLEAMLRPWDIGASPLYRHIIPEQREVEAVGASMLPGLLTELEQDPKFAFLREEPAFWALLERYWAKCPQAAGAKPTDAKHAWASSVER